MPSQGLGVGCVDVLHGVLEELRFLILRAERPGEGVAVLLQGCHLILQLLHEDILRLHLRLEVPLPFPLVVQRVLQILHAGPAAHADIISPPVMTPSRRRLESTWGGAVPRRDRLEGRQRGGLREYPRGRPAGADAPVVVVVGCAATTPQLPPALLPRLAVGHAGHGGLMMGGLSRGIQDRGAQGGVLSVSERLRAREWGG